MSEQQLVEFFKYLARNTEARRLLDEVLGMDKCNTDKCKRCVEAKVNYWFMKWLFGIRPDPLEAARDIHSCLGGQQ